MNWYTHRQSNESLLPIHRESLFSGQKIREKEGNATDISLMVITESISEVSAWDKNKVSDALIKEAGIIVDWSGLMPGMIGVYQINCRIPGNHYNGNALPVTLRIGGVSSATTGPTAAVVYVD